LFYPIIAENRRFAIFVTYVKSVTCAENKITVVDASVSLTRHPCRVILCHPGALVPNALVSFGEAIERIPENKPLKELGEKAKLLVHKAKLDELVKSPKTVIPAKAGIHK
jgi:hypothetical protein